MLRRDGRNADGWTFWKLTVPEEVGAAAGLEVMVRASPEGLVVGDGIIPWADVDDALGHLNMKRPEWAWVIEHGDTPTNMPACWTGLRTILFSSDSTQAVRFASKEHAEVVAGGILSSYPTRVTRRDG